MKLADALTQILREKYERRVDKESGVSLAVWNVKLMGRTVILGDNAAYYEVNFDVLTYLPQINEVVESEVSEIVEFGVFVTLGQ